MKRKIGFGTVVFLFVALQCWTMYLTLSYPNTDIIVDKDKQGYWYIQKYGSDHVSSQLGVRIGDRIVLVNDQDPDRYFTIVRWRTLEQFRTLTVDRNGDAIRITSVPVPDPFNYDMLPLIGESISIFIAVLLIRKLPGSLSAQYLSYVFGNIGVIFMSLGASMRGDPLGKTLIFISIMLLPIFFLRFLMILLQEKGTLPNPSRLIQTLYVVVGVASAFVISCFFNWEISYMLYNAEFMFAVIFFLFGLILNFVYLTLMYRKHRNQKSYVSVMIKTIWVSFFISFSPIMFFSFLPRLLSGKEWLDSFVTGWFILLFPLTFAYLIASKKLYDIDMFVRRVALTLVVSLPPSLLFVGVIGLLFPKEADTRHLSIVFVSLVACLTFVLYSYEYFTTKLQAVVFPRKHRLQVALKNIATNLRAITSFRDLKNIILVDIVKTLQVQGGAFVFKYNASMETIIEGEVDAEKVQRLIAANMSRDEDYSCIKINRHEEYTSYLIIGRKMTGTMLGTEELQWVSLIVTYLAVSLENVYLIQKLTMKVEQLAMQIQNEDAARQLIWFRKLMFELQEKERTRIATDLHDTTMQDLFFLKQRLNSLLQRYAYTAEDHKHLLSLLDYIDIINVNLRQSCFELHPYMLKEIGLVKTIEKLVEFEAAVSTFKLYFHARCEDIIERKDLETKRHIFRMIQELINNAKKHSKAKKIKMVLSASPSSIYFIYEDDGVGFDAERSGTGDTGSSGIGIDQIKSRIFSLNGQYEFVTGTGKGVKFIATIPLKEGITA